MIPIENIDTINKRIKDHYGSTNDLPKFRIVFSTDQYEKRLTNYTDEGLELLYPEVRLLPKYKQWKPDRYVLEKLTEVNNSGVTVDKLSYEPIWFFEDNNNLPLRPAWIAAKMIIDTVNKNMEQAGMYTKYKDPLAGLTTVEQLEKKSLELDEMKETLFGNETSIGDALAYRYGIGYTGPVKEN